MPSKHLSEGMQMKAFVAHGLKGFMLFAALFALCGASVDSFFDVIIQVESGNDPDTTGDQGRSRGLAQISRPYYIDARQEMARHGITPPPYEEAVKDRVWTKSLMWHYMLRYCPQALADEDFETIARTHNGGPMGAHRTATVKYWIKVQKSMNKTQER